MTDGESDGCGFINDINNSLLSPYMRALVQTAAFV